MAEPATDQMQRKVFNVSADILPEMNIVQLTTTEVAFFRLGKITKLFDFWKWKRRWGENMTRTSAPAVFTSTKHKHDLAA